MTEPVWTRRSLYYPAAYLLSGGLAFLLAPTLAFRLFFSNQASAYGDGVPRMAGALTVALGLLVVQTIRHRVSVLHGSLVGVRVFLVGAWLWLLVRTHDPFFGTLAAMVALGVVLSTVAGFMDRKAAPGGAG